MTQHAETHAEHNSEENHQGHGEHGQIQEDIVFFVLIMLLFGAIMREVNKKTGIPYTPLVVVLGMFMEFMKSYAGYMQVSLGVFSVINPHLLLLLFIPVLIFESAYNMDFYVFRKSIINVLLLAVPGVLITAFLLGFVLKGILGYTDEESITWNAALTMGAIYAATDPVAVVALLKELGAPLKFNVLIEGESLLNDGTAMVFFQVFLNLVQGQSSEPLAVAGNFIRLAICGPILGLVAGIIACYWLRRVIRDDVLTSLITVLATYIVFYVAEFTALHVSGILAVVTLGCFMSAVGKTKIYAESEHSLHVMWMFLQYSCETLIFLLTGILIGRQFTTDTHIVGQDWINLIIFYIFMLLARGIMVFIFYPFYEKGGYALNVREVLVLAYGGLRGALGLCLALIIGVDETLPPRFRALTVFFMAGIAILTLVLNGLTAKQIVEKLGIITVPQIRYKILKNTIQSVVQETRKDEKQLKNDKFLSLAKWKEVQEYTGMSEILKTFAEEEIQKKKELESQRDRQDDESSGNTPLRNLRASLVDYAGLTEEEINMELRYNVLKSMKGFVWEFYEQGELSTNSTYIMDDSIYLALDYPASDINVWGLIMETLENKWLTNWLLPYKDTVFIGPIIKTAITNNMTSLYEMSTVYLNVLEHAKHSLKYIPVRREFLDPIQVELENEEVSAQDFIMNLVTAHPDIMAAIQTKRASSLLLHHLKQHAIEKKEHGVLDDKDYLRVRKMIDRKIVALEQKNIPWSVEHFDKIMIKCPLFTNLNKEDIKNISAKARKLVYKKGVAIIRKNTPVQDLMIVTAGIAEDKITKDCQKMCTPGSVISAASIISSADKSLSEVIAKTEVQVYAFPVKDINDLMKKNYRFNKNMIVQSLFYFIKLKHENSFLKNLEDSELMVYLSQVEIDQVDKGTEIRFVNGGIVLIGEIAEVDAKDQIYKKFNVIDDSGIKFICNTDSVIVQFEKKITKKIQSGGAEEEKSKQSNRKISLLSVEL